MRSIVTALGRKAHRVLKSKRGFTLMEVLIVVAIIGVLAAIAVPNVTRALNTAKQNADAANVATLENAVNMYFIDKGEWPTAGVDFQDQLVAEGYIKEVVTSPLGNQYSLQIDEETSTATVTSTPQQP